MKKKLALLMAAIMTVAMVPVTALAATKLTVAKDVQTGVGDDYVFDGLVELKNDNTYYGSSDVENEQPGGTSQEVVLRVKLTNGKFAKADGVVADENDVVANKVDNDGVKEDGYIMNDYRYLLEKEIIVHEDGTDDSGYVTSNNEINSQNADVDFGNGYKSNLKNENAPGDKPSSKDSLIRSIKVKSDVLAEITLTKFPAGSVVAIPIKAYAVDAGDVTATISSNGIVDFTTSGVIAVANDNDVQVESEGIVTFVEDSGARVKKMKPITISGLYNTAINTEDNSITLRLKGNYKFKLNSAETGLGDANANTVNLEDVVSFLNDGIQALNGSTAAADENNRNASYISEDKIIIRFTTGTDVKKFQTAEIYIDGIYITPTKSCEPVDVAKLTLSSKDFSSTTIEVAKMVEEAVTYTVEDDELPTIWAGKDYGRNADLDDTNTLKVSVEENTGDILNTSRKATFTFPDGIEVVGFKIKGAPVISEDSNDANKLDERNGLGSLFTDKPAYEIDENVLTIWNYQKKATVDESDSEKGKTDFDIDFILNAAPSFNGDVEVTLGGEFDDVTLKVATVKAPYTVEAKTTEVLIDYRYVPVNEIVITEAKDGLLEDKDVISLYVEKMDFEDAGAFEVTAGDIEVDVDVNNGTANLNQLNITVKDESTEASTIVISGLELYLDRTLPVGGYALYNVGELGLNLNGRSTGTMGSNNILWENSSDDKDDYDLHGIFRYKDLVCNDAYVEVVTQARDQDDYTTNRKIVLTIGATTMAVGTETITLDTPAYINSENYTQLPLRAVSEAFGATVNWDDASRTVTIMMGQRVVSMTIGSKTMYVNGTPVAMNTAPEITNERTFVPVRDLANALGITKIDWNEASATVTLN